MTLEFYYFKEKRDFSKFIDLIQPKKSRQQSKIKIQKLKNKVKKLFFFKAENYFNYQRH